MPAILWIILAVLGFFFLQKNKSASGVPTAKNPASSYDGIQKFAQTAAKQQGDAASVSLSNALKSLQSSLSGAGKSLGGGGSSGGGGGSRGGSNSGNSGKNPFDDNSTGFNDVNDYLPGNAQPLGPGNPYYADTYINNSPEDQGINRGSNFTDTGSSFDFNGDLNGNGGVNDGTNDSFDFNAGDTTNYFDEGGD